MEAIMNQEKEKQENVTDTSNSKVRPFSGGAPEANVDAAGHCILTQDGEMARPNSGEPCDEGTGG